MLQLLISASILSFGVRGALSGFQAQLLGLTTAWSLELPYVRGAEQGWGTPGVAC